MATSGQVLTNPLTGDTYEFLETAQDSQGKRVSVKMHVRTKGKLVPDHLHALQDETFEVLDGELTILLENKIHVLHAGDSIKLPVNHPHNHYNTGTEPVVFIHRVSPALDFEFLVENLVGLSSDGKRPNGKGNLLQELVTLRYIDSKSFLAHIPIGVQKFLMNTLGPLGRALGYRAIYKKYSGFEK